MWEIFQSIGSFDKLKRKGSLRHYKKVLKEHREHEAETLVDMGMLCLNKERYDKSLKYLKQANLIYKKIKYEEGQAFVYDLIGDVYISMREIDKALDNYQDSFKTYAAIRSPMKPVMLEKIKEVEAIKDVIALSTKEDDESWEIVEEAINEVQTEELPLKEKRDKCQLNFEKVIIKLEDIKKLIKRKYRVKGISKEEYETGYTKKSIIDIHDREDFKKELATHLVLGIFLLEEKRTYIALKNFKESFFIAHEIGDTKGEAFSLLLLGVTYYILSSEAQIYDVFKKSLELFRSLNDKEGESIAIDLMDTLYKEDVCAGDEIIDTV